MNGERTFTAARAARLDRLVAEQLPELSRSQAKRVIDEAGVHVNGTLTTKAGTTVAPGTVVTVRLPVAPDLDQYAEEVPLDVLYEDEHTLVLNKQAGLLVHPVNGQTHVTLVNAVRARYPEVRDIDDGNRPGVVHRLDRDTSGVIAYAKSQVAQSHLKEQWRRRETLKLYLALVAGHPDPPEGIIDAPLGPDPGDPRRRAVVERGDRAQSEYHVREQYGDEAALVEIRIHTGRTHQIRVHMEAIGYPVLGDTQYGRRSELIDRQALHAWRLGLTLVATGQWQEFVAPLPPDMRAAIEQLRTRWEVDAVVDLGDPQPVGEHA